MNTAKSIVLDAEKRLQNASTVDQIEQVRVDILGKKGALTELLKGLGKLSAGERPSAGQAINAAKRNLIRLLDEKREQLAEGTRQKDLISTAIDVTMPGRGRTNGSAHPVSQVQAKIEDLFHHVGFEVARGPEIEDEYHNFEALNIPKHHPARAMHDTFYFKPDLLLRTHTSPVQIRVMKEKTLPIRIIAPGRVYRCDYDQTHSPMFHQVEGLWIDEIATMAELKGMLNSFLLAFFERDDLEIRYRPSYFPFTEPSMEVDIKLPSAHGLSGWLEVLGCGMVHPNVLTNVGLDPGQCSGFAFGMGVERLAMLKYGISDLRHFFENDLRRKRESKIKNQ
jgi:phenylalanyl-tRNA synthetase alpha chain